MGAGWNRQELIAPIAGDRPCGEDLEDTPLLASFDSFRVFGESRPLDAPADEGENWTPKPPDAPIWRDIRAKALETLARSRDARLLAYLGAAVLRVEGLPAFCETLGVAQDWLQTYWKESYPPVDEDAILRRNALNCFADPMAVIEALRRVPLVSSRQHGRFTLRDVEIATGQLAAPEGDARVTEAQINAAFAAMPIEELTMLHDSVSGALASLQALDATMRLEGGTDAAPNFEALTTQLTKMARVLRAQLSMRGEGAQPGAVTEASTASGASEAGRGMPGGIRSRDDAVRALDAVADFFRRAEPSSPVPLIVERAKRLVAARDFMEVLADIAPDAVAQARLASGMRNPEE